MVEYRNIIVLQDRGGFRKGLTQELTDYGFAVRCCNSMSGFCQLYESFPARVVVLVGMPHRIITDVRKIREKSALVAIVALGSGTSTVERVHTMIAGANAYCDIFMDISELTTILMIWGRYSAFAMRRETRTSTEIEVKVFASWHLEMNGRVLISPTGRTLPLTHLEGCFLRHMAASEGHLLHRNGKSNMDNAQGIISETRNIEVLVSRLRRKAQCAGIKLPLIAIRGCGYLFAECLDIATLTNSPDQSEEKLFEEPPKHYKLRALKYCRQ